MVRTSHPEYLHVCHTTHSQCLVLIITLCRLWSYICNSSALRAPDPDVTESASQLDNSPQTDAQPQIEVEVRRLADIPDHCNAEATLATIQAHDTPMIPCSGAQMPLCAPDQVDTHAGPQQAEGPGRPLVDATHQQSSPDNYPSSSRGPNFLPDGVRKSIELPPTIIPNNNAILHTPQPESAAVPEACIPEKSSSMFPAASNAEAHDVGKGTAHSVPSW